MPGFDGTGPRGEGPMTGGARGYCNPPATSFYGRGYGPGRGFRGGFGRRWASLPGAGPYGTAYSGPYGMSREDELKRLRNQADMMKADMDAVNRRIEELETEPSQS